MNGTCSLVLILPVLYMSNPSMQSMLLQLKAIVTMSFWLFLLQNTCMCHSFLPVLPCLWRKVMFNVTRARCRNVAFTCTLILTLLCTVWAQCCKARSSWWYSTSLCCRAACQPIQTHLMSQRIWTQKYKICMNAVNIFITYTYTTI